MSAATAVDNIRCEIARLGELCERALWWERAERDLLHLGGAEIQRKVAERHATRAFSLAMSLPLEGRA